MGLKIQECLFQAFGFKSLGSLLARFLSLFLLAMLAKLHCPSENQVFFFQSACVPLHFFFFYFSLSITPAPHQDNHVDFSPCCFCLRCLPDSRTEILLSDFKHFCQLIHSPRDGAEWKMLVLYCCVQNPNRFDSTQSEVSKGTGSFTFISVAQRIRRLQTSAFIVDRVAQRWAEPAAFLRLHLDGAFLIRLWFTVKCVFLYFLFQ